VRASINQGVAMMVQVSDRPVQQMGVA